MTSFTWILPTWLVAQSDALRPPVMDLAQDLVLPTQAAGDLDLRAPSDGALQSHPCSVFVNFDDPSNPFGADEGKRKALIDAMEQDLAPFVHKIYTTRPSFPVQACRAGMASCGGGPNGQANLDCGNRAGPNDPICYANVCAGQNPGQAPAHLQAHAVMQEFVHTLGLLHVNDPQDILTPSGNPSINSTFKDQCLTVLPPTDCLAQLKGGCPSGQQNSYREMAAICGLAAPDTEPPQVRITAPADKMALPECATFTITAEATDNQGLASVKLTVNQTTVIGTDSTAPYTWDAKMTPGGTYVFVADAVDRAGNHTTSAPVTVTVATGACGASSMPGTSAGPGTGGNSATAGSTTTATAGTGGPTSYGSTSYGVMSATSGPPPTTATTYASGPLGQTSSGATGGGGCQTYSPVGGPFWATAMFLALWSLARRSKNHARA